VVAASACVSSAEYEDAALDMTTPPEEHPQADVFGIVFVVVNLVLVVGAMILLLNAKRLRKKQATEDESEHS